MSKRRVPWVMRLVILVIRPFLMLTTRRDWRGADQLPATGGFVLAPNHLSHIDPFTISHFMVNHDLVPRFLAKDTLFEVPVGGWLLRKTEQIPVYRKSARASEAFSAAVDAVRGGKVITVYPEGTVTRDPALWPMSGKTGAVRIALESGCPLVPLAHWGEQEILWPYRKGFHWLPRKTIHVRIGAPMDLSAYAGKPLTTEVLESATTELIDRITELLADVRGERPVGDRIDLHTVEGKHDKHPHTEVE